MATWFGHTQTITSLGKSVSGVANGILGLESNLANFMKKVIYYDKFFQRIRPNIPNQLVATAELLFARCYEYRDEIRDELESSFAYVADAGRWIVGFEDWNSKMQKRMEQINEIVILANSLLAEYAITGKHGALGSQDELNAFLQEFSASIVLRNTTTKDKKTIKTTKVSVTSSVPVHHEYQDQKISLQSIKEQAHETEKSEHQEEQKGTSQVLQQIITVIENTKPPASNKVGQLETVTYITGETMQEDYKEHITNVGDSGDDEDFLNPFAQSYQQRNDVVDSSIPTITSQEDVNNHVTSIKDSQSSIELEDNADCDSDTGSTYECLDVPQTKTFKYSRVHLADDKSEHRRDLANRISIENRIENAHSSTTEIKTNGKPQKLRDLMYSYDFAREAECNPFASPTMADQCNIDLPKLDELHDSN